MKRTKMVCTIGPASEDVEALTQLLQAGMNVARFNFSHGSHDEHLRRFEAVRRASVETGLPVALLLDTKGPETRIGRIQGGVLSLQEGDTVLLTANTEPSAPNELPVMPSSLLQDISPGMVVLLSDGLISLRVEEKRNDIFYCVVLNKGSLKENKRITVPGVKLSLPSLSPRDVEDILFGVSQKVDFIAVSFVQQASDVLAVRQVLEEAKSDSAIIAKIENAAGVENLEEILTVADGIMVARGDLGVEIPAEEVPLVQKSIIAACNQAGKPVITATQMLESMIENPRPTRAEASDIANAILDGSDAIMLSGETAAGKYPVEAAKTMARIAMRTEQSLNMERLSHTPGHDNQCTITDAVSWSTVAAARALGADAILTATESGYTARMIAKYRPNAPIIATSPNVGTVRKLLLSYGVYPLVGEKWGSSDQLIQGAITKSLESGQIQTGNLVVITAGLPAGTPGTTNMMRVEVIGEIIVKGLGIGSQVVSGKAVVLSSTLHLNDLESGTVVFTTSVEKEYMPYLQSVAAIVTEEAGITSSGAIFGVSFGVPVIVGAENCTNVMRTGMLVTVDTRRGLVYSGRTKVR